MCMNVRKWATRACGAEFKVISDEADTLTSSFLIEVFHFDPFQIYSFIAFQYPFTFYPFLFFNFYLQLQGLLLLQLYPKLFSFP